MILNRGKTSVPTIINGSKVISSSLDKAKLFVMNIVSNLTLDDKGHLISWQSCLTTSSRRNVSKVYGKQQLYALFTRMQESVHSNCNIVPSVNSLSLLSTKTNFQSNKQFGFHPSSPLLVSLHKHTPTPQSDHFRYPKGASDNAQHKWLLHKLSSHGISERQLAIIISFLSGKSMKGVINV